MDPTGQPSRGLNKLACLGCKVRKTRCNRATPTCDRCISRRQTCIYPGRRNKKRARVTTVHPQQATSGLALSTLFERVQQVETQCSRLLAASMQAGSERESIALVGDVFRCQSSAGPVPSAQSPSAQSTISLTASRTETDTVAEAPNAACSASDLSPSMNASALLKQALDKVLDLRRQNVNKQTANFDIHIRPELAKACLKSKGFTSAHQLGSILALVLKPVRPLLTAYADFFYKHYQIDSFPGFINTKLMYLIPDIIDIPEISLDPAALVLYYSILYQGSLRTCTEMTPQDENFSQRTYLSCHRAIPAWQRRATGTKTDLIAAILLMQAASQQGDFEFGWHMYKLVYQYVQNLNMHNIDRGISSTLMDPELLSDEADHHRRGLWALVLVDLFFRLLYDKPAILTANLTEWRVNLPRLNIDPELTEHAVPTMAFLVKSRLTFLLLRFFDIISHGAEDNNSVINRVEGLCADIEDLFEEWSVRDSMKAHEDNVAYWWMLYDLTLTGYCSIMFMRRKMAVLQSDLSGTFNTDEDVPMTTLSINTARRIMDLALLSLGKYPHPATASTVFGAFRCYVAYGSLARHLFCGDPRELGSAAATDMALLEQVAQSMSAIAEMDKDFVPLVRTFHELNTGIHAKWKATTGVPF